MRLFQLNPRPTMKLGGKNAPIAKLTPVKTRQAFEIIENIPGIVFQVLAAPVEERHAYIMVAIDESIEEVCALVSVLSGVDKEYIMNEVGVDEIYDYLVALAKANNLGELLKNSKALMAR